MSPNGLAASAADRSELTSSPMCWSAHAIRLAAASATRASCSAVTPSFSARSRRTTRVSDGLTASIDDDGVGDASRRKLESSAPTIFCTSTIQRTCATTSRRKPSTSALASSASKAAPGAMNTARSACS